MEDKEHTEHLSAMTSAGREMSRRALLRGSVGGLMAYGLLGRAPTALGEAVRTQSRLAAVAPKGTLRVALSDMREQNWLPNTGSGTRLYVGAVFDYPLMGRIDRPGLAPGLITAYRLAPDAKSLVAAVRKGVRFHNGTPLTSEDLRFTFEMQRYANSQDPNANLWREAVTSIDTSHPYLITYKFNRPIADFAAEGLSLYSFFPTVNSKAYLHKVGLAAADKHPIGTGPYRWQSQKPDYIELSAVPNNWRVTPQFQRLIFTQVPDQATQIAQLQAGEVDLINVDVLGAQQLSGDHRFHEFSYPAAYNAMLLFGNNYDAGDPRFTASSAQPWHDIRVRKALNLAINRDQIIKSLYRGQATAARLGIFDPNLPASYKPYPYNPTEATTLLKQAGYGPGELSIKLMSWVRNPGTELPTLVQIVAGFWNAIGVKVSIISEDYATFRPAWFAGKIPNTIFPLTLNTFYPSWESVLGQWFAPGGTIATYQDNTLTGIEKQLVTTLDARGRAALFEKAAIDMYNNYSEVPIAIPNSTYFASSSIGTWTPPSHWYPMYYEYVTHHPSLHTPVHYVPNVAVRTLHG